MRFISVPNGGGGEPGISSQCMWICIKDYLNYHRGQITTVIQLKKQVGLGPETNHMEYNHDNLKLRDALTRLCQQLNISVCFIYTRRDGTIAPYCLENDRMKPFAVINGGTGNNVFVATFGGHFELIIQGPNYNLQRHQNATIRGSSYEPKVQINNNFVNPSQVSSLRDKEIAQASIKLVEITQNIDYFREELRRVQLEIKNNEEGLANTMELGLEPEETQMLSTNYLRLLDDYSHVAASFINKIEELNVEKQSLELIISQF